MLGGYLLQTLVYFCFQVYILQLFMDTYEHMLSLTETGVYLGFGTLLESEPPEMELEYTMKGKVSPE